MKQDSAAGLREASPFPVLFRALDNFQAFLANRQQSFSYPHFSFRR